MVQAAPMFVSHCDQDDTWCREFVALLRRAGGDVWYDDRHLGYGRRHDVVERELRARSIFLFVLSPAGLADPTPVVARFSPDRRAADASSS